MIKTLTLLVRRDDWSHEQFVEYWQNVHGPIARHIKQIRRYVQSECLDEIVRSDIPSMGEKVDGVAEVWYDSRESMQEARISPQGQALLADGAKFIGRARTLIMGEREIIAGAAQT